MQKPCKRGICALSSTVHARVHVPQLQWLKTFLMLRVLLTLLGHVASIFQGQKVWGDVMGVKMPVNSSLSVSCAGIS